MGILDRLLDVSKASIHEALDKLEQPGMMMNYYLRTMQEELEALRQAAAREEIAAATFGKQAAAAAVSAEGAERRAAEALANDRPAEARLAIEAKLAYEEQAAESKRLQEAALRRAAELAVRLDQAKAELSAMTAKRDELAKRAAASAEHDGAYRASAETSFDAGAAARGFRRIEDSLLQRELEADRLRAEREAAAAAREALIEEQLRRLRGEARNE
ncbi:PspA/IM30 family protein [Paenibacillus sp. TRM 82003]|nr:PspA/IM30 family protein [Paenibacillus sp. TRM 82003]